MDTITRRVHVFSDVRDTAGAAKGFEGWPQFSTALRGVASRLGKLHLRLLKLGYFRGGRSEEHLVEICGVEGDYDRGQITAEQAVQMLDAAGLMGLVYETPSSTPEHPRWRVLVPTRTILPGAARRVLAQRLMRVFPEGALDPCTLKSAQTFYFGGVVGKEWVVLDSSGELYIDDLVEKDAVLAASAAITEARAEYVGVNMGCPFGEGHSDGRGLGEDSSFQQRTNKTTGEVTYHCAHASCAHRDSLALEVGLIRAGVLESPFKPRVQGDDWFSGLGDRRPVEQAPSGDWVDFLTLPEEPSAPGFIIPGWLPRGTVTLFSAHGGTGKSYLSLLIGMCLALGRDPFTGEAIAPQVVVLYSAEDGMQVLQYRLRRYMRLLGVSPTALRGQLHVLDATLSSNVLYSERGGVTERAAWLARECAERGATVLIFDNASDALDANENDRAKVRQFMSALRRVCETVLLLAHVDAASVAATAGNGQTPKGYSGSTAWNNSSRSRWHMYPGSGSRTVLERSKANYAAASDSALVEWCTESQVFVIKSVVKTRAVAVDNRPILLRLAAKFIAAGTRISPHFRAINSAHNVLSGDPEYPFGMTAKGMHDEVQGWILAGLAAAEEYKKNNRMPAEQLVLTQKGAEIAQN